MRALLLLGLAWAAARAAEPLPATRLQELKKSPCAFVHVWAAWCEPCVEELPKLVPLLGGMKGVTPVVIDVSSVTVQESFSKKFMAKLKPSFRTYLKPAGPEEDYLNAIDKGWQGGLPYSVLYRKGQKKKEWVGKLDLDGLKAEIEKGCR